MAIPGFSAAWQLVRRLESLFEDVTKLVQGSALVRDQLVQLEKRIAALEGREELLIERAKGAASAAASAVVIQSVTDIARRVGALEAGGIKRVE